MDNSVFARHDSRLKEFRRPFGAAREGESIRLYIEAQGVARAKLRLWRENRQEIIEGEKCGGGFTFAFLTGGAGIIWYYFILETKDGTRYLGSSSPLGCGDSRISENEPNSWQITVYQACFETPESAKGAMAYQIFPDRFFKRGRGGLARTQRREALNWDTVAHEDWDEEVMYTPLPNKRDYDPCDFYGGDLDGISAKLDYLAEIGVTHIYLNPIFEAQANHRYNTGDYHRVDEMLGGEEALKRLIAEAKKRGIRLMLDGVFSHTGAESAYFNKTGRYPGLGAYQGEGSAYYSWYGFEHFPDKYACWWGFESLPEVNELDRGYMAFIAGVVDHYAKLGIDSWRLDVADELPDEFIAFLRRELKSRCRDGLLIGEVWEDASTKCGPNGRRRYTDGHELDGVMNYPFMEAVYGFLLNRIDAPELALRLTALRQNYPKAFYESSLSMLSSHDTLRLLTALSGAPDRNAISREEQAVYRPDADMLRIGKKRVTQAQLIQLLHPGIPCVYYGDEAGMEGMADPFSRRTYPWGKEDEEIKGRFMTIARLRRESDAIRYGKCCFAYKNEDVFIILRSMEKSCAMGIVNRSGREKSFYIDRSDFSYGSDADGVMLDTGVSDVLDGGSKTGENGRMFIRIKPYSAMLLC